MTYEVDSATGTCLYRGYDLELACDILAHEIGAHLQMIAEDARQARDRIPRARVAAE